MKKNNIIIVLTILFSISLTAFTTEETSSWMTNYQEAVNLAKKENKLILMDFSGSDWCANCIRLERGVFEKEVFKKYAQEKFILLKIDFPVKKKNKLSAELTKQNEGLADIYNKEGQFPTIIILDANEKLLAKTGYKPGTAEDYIQHLNSLLQ